MRCGLRSSHHPGSHHSWRREITRESVPEKRVSRLRHTSISYRPKVIHPPRILRVIVRGTRSVAIPRDATKWKLLIGKKFFSRGTECTSSASQVGREEDHHGEIDDDMMMMMMTIPDLSKLCRLVPYLLKASSAILTMTLELRSPGNPVTM